MKKIISLIMVGLLVAGSFDVAAQNKPRGGKKKATPFIEGRQKVRQDDYDTLWKFTNFSTKDTRIYYMPYAHDNTAEECQLGRPDAGGELPAKDDTCHGNHLCCLCHQS